MDERIEEQLRQERIDYDRMRERHERSSERWARIFVGILALVMLWLIFTVVAANGYG